MECDDGICFVYSFLGHLVAYFAILALLVTICVMTMKCVGDWRARNSNEVARIGETAPLMHRNHPGAMVSVTINYGACHQDNECENCNNCSNCSAHSNCVICYNQQRDCFFVPCGHCATCYACAQRIYFEESRNCPICRRYIGKIRRLFDS